MRAIATIVAVAAVAGVAGFAGAYTVSPLRILLEPSGPGATQRVTISNTEAQPITLSVRALRNSIAEDGTLTTSPAGGDLSVFPPRAVLQPGASQTIQVRYTGAAAAGPAVYSIHVAQVPVNATQGQAQIKVATEFYVAALVQPKGVASNMQVKGMARGAGGAVTVTVQNSGTGIGRMSSGSWVAQTAAGPVTLAPNDLDYGGTAYILPGTTRVIRVKPEQAAKVAGATAMTFTPSNG